MPKLKGLAVIAAGVGNPPAPGRQGQRCMGVFRTEGQKRQISALRQSTRTPPTHPRPRIFLLKSAQDASQTPLRCLFLPILPPSSWHLFSDALLECPKMPPRRPQLSPRAAQERPRAPQDAPGLLKWSHVEAHVGSKIQFRRYHLLKQPEG